MYFTLGKRGDAVLERLIAFEPKLTIDGLIALFGFLTAIGAFLWERAIERNNQRKATYLSLEMSANELMRFAADNPELVLILEGHRGMPKSGTTAYVRYVAYVCQAITLFEVSMRFVREGIMPREIFATWVPWMSEFVLTRNFGKIWPEVKVSYHGDCTSVIDRGVEIARRNKFRTMNKSRQEFYEYVAEHFGDPGIKTFTKSGEYPE